VSIAAQRERIAALSQGQFGRMIINPRRLITKGDDGYVIFTYEGDETRGGPKGRLHRSIVKFGETGVPKEGVLQRNFDVFTEIWIPSKL